jgi:hypothetical protein
VCKNSLPDTQLKFMEQIGDKNLIKIESMLKQAFRESVLVDEDMLSKHWILRIKPYPGRNK